MPWACVCLSCRRPCKGLRCRSHCHLRMTSLHLPTPQAPAAPAAVAAAALCQAAAATAGPLLPSLTPVHQQQAVAGQAAAVALRSGQIWRRRRPVWWCLRAKPCLGPSASQTSPPSPSQAARWVTAAGAPCLPAPAVLEWQHAGRPPNCTLVKSALQAVTRDAIHSNTSQHYPAVSCSILQYFAISSSASAWLLPLAAVLCGCSRRPQDACNCCRR